MPVIELSMSGRPKSGRVVGIDLGTTNSLVAYMSDGGPEVIRDRDGAALDSSESSRARFGSSRSSRSSMAGKVSAEEQMTR